MRLGLREANQHFSKAIPIAIIRPLPEPDPTERTVRQLEAAGLLEPAEVREPLPPWRPRRIRGKGLSQTVREDRDTD